LLVPTSVGTMEDSMTNFDKKYKNIDTVSEFVLRVWGKQSLLVSHTFYDTHKDLLQSGEKEKITTALASIITLAISMYLQDTMSTKDN